MTNTFELTTTLRNIIDEIAEIAQYLWLRGWAERNAGNISINVTEYISQDTQHVHRSQFTQLRKNFSEIKNCYYLTTTSGSRMRDVAKQTEENVCIIQISENADGYSFLWSGNNKNSVPTSELPAHLSIHQMLKSTLAPEKAILHTQPAELIALSHSKKYLDEKLLNNILWSMQPETIIINPKGIGVIPYFVTGSDELADATAKMFSKHNIILWEKHGTVAIGNTITDAFDLTDVYVKSAQIFLICKNAGYEPEGLSKKQLEELVKRFSL